MPEHESSSARRRATRNAAAQEAKRAQLWRDNRRLVINALPWVIGSAVATAAYGILRLSEGPPSDEDIILAEAKRLGIEQSHEEKALWESAYTLATPINPAVSQLEEADKRLKDVLRRMNRSQNPYYIKGYNGLIQYVPNDIDLRYTLTNEASMAVGYELSESGGFRRIFNVNPDFMTTGSTALSAADTIVHEARHLVQHESVLADLQARYSGPDFYKNAIAYFSDTNLGNQNEFEAYTLEAQSLIYEAGLVGHVYSPALQKITGKEDRAVKFIQYGSNSNSPEWQAYLGSIILSPKIEQVQ